MNTFMQPFFLSPMTVPDEDDLPVPRRRHGDARQGGVGTRILSQGVAWAREKGYEHVALHFATPNLSGRQVLAEQRLRAGRVRHAPPHRRTHRLGEQVGDGDDATTCKALVDDVTDVVRGHATMTMPLRRASRRSCGAGWTARRRCCPRQYTQPCDGGACGHLLYTDPEGEYFVISVVFPSGTSSGVHYHGAWGVIGILAGHRRRDEVRARRVTGRHQHRPAAASCGPSRRSTRRPAPSPICGRRSRASTA